MNDHENKLTTTNYHDVSVYRDTLWTDKFGNPVAVKDLSDEYLFESYTYTSSNVLFREMVYRLFNGRIDARKAYKA